MDWSNWKIYLVLVILVAVVILILWYRCPTENFQKLPGRPDSQKFLAPAPVLSPANPSTFCSISSNITTKWGCNFDTTIYNVEDVHFKLSYTGSDNNEIVINSNITDETDGLTMTNVGGDFHYSYDYSLTGVVPDYYILNIVSFVPNVPEATVRHCSTCTQDLKLLPSQYSPVPSIDVDSAVYYYGLEGSRMINVTWVDAPVMYPLPGEQTFYNLSLQDSSGSVVNGTNIVLDYGQTSYQYDPDDVGPGSDFQAVIYVTQNPDSGNPICTLDSSNSISGSFDILSFSMPSISTSPGNSYCTSDSNFQVVWSVDCSSYTGPASCPSDFDYSVHINDSDTGFDLFFDQLSIDGGSACDQEQPTYCGALTNTNNTYTFTIKPMLPVGNYDQTVSMFLPDPDQGESNEEVSDTSPSPAVVKNPSDGSTQSSRNVKSDATQYAIGNVITCTWDAPTDPNYQYTYEVSLLDSGGNLVEGSVCSNLTQTNYKYTIYDIYTEPSCGVTGMNITLEVGESYNVNVTTTSTIPGDWCDQSVFIDSGVTGANSFEIFNCLVNSDCKLPSWDTDLLTTDSVRKGIYNLWCIYSDDPSQCLINVGQSFNGSLSSNDLAINTKDIPNSVCSTVSGTKTCVRGTCPMLATPNGTGCIAPGQDVQQSWMRNSIPTAKSGQFISDVLNQSYVTDSYSGIPFIPFIQTDTSNTQQLTDNMDLVPVPGAVDSGWNIYLYPFYMKYFHPFLIWTFIGSGYPVSAYTEDVKCETGMGSNPFFYYPYHTGSSTYAQTQGCHARSFDDGISCYLRFGNVKPSNAAIQNKGKDYSNLTTFGTWGGNPPYNSTHYDVNSYGSKSSTYGKCGGIYNSAQFNTPADNGDNRQNAWYFGSSGNNHACQLYHRDKGNGMRMMVLTDIPGGNNKYWKGLINTYGWNSNTVGDRNPRIPGPPYSNNNRDPVITANSFCAPVQYGVLTVGKSGTSPPTQSEFYLEAYTWDSTYTIYNGLGFMDASSITNLTDNAITFSTSWSGSDYYESETHNQMLYLSSNSKYMSSSNLAGGSHQTSLVWSSIPQLCVMDPSGAIRTQVGSTWLYLAINSNGNIFWIEPGYQGISGYENYTIPMWAMTWVTVTQATSSTN